MALSDIVQRLSQRELEVWFYNSYINLKGKKGGKNYPYFINSVHIGEDGPYTSGTYYLKDKTGRRRGIEKSIIFSQEVGRLDFFPSGVKLFNSENQLCYFKRIPSGNQWRRGLTKRNCSFLNVGTQLTRSPDFFLEDLIDIFNTKYVSLLKAIDLVGSEIRGCAVDEEYGLSLNRYNNKILFFHLNDPIGEYDKGVKKIILTSPMFYEECTERFGDYFYRS